MNSARFEKWGPRLALALVMAWPLLIITRGFDLTDSGYYLVSYRYAFSWPEVNALSVVLSNWLGGLICALLPETGQYLVLRVVCVAIYALVTWLSYVILREHFPVWLNIAALALANVYPAALIYITSYNSLSYLFLSAAILLLYRGLSRDRPLLLYLAAIILGLNPFVRLPNILQWGLAAVPFWHYWFCLGQRRAALRLTLRFSLVILLSWLVFFCLARLALGPEIVDRQLDGLTGLLHGSGETSRHSVFTMWDTYDMFIREGGWILFHSAPLLPLSLALAAGLTVFRRREAVLVLAALGLATGFAFAFIGGNYYVPYILHVPVWSDPLNAFLMFYCLAGPLAALLGMLWYHQRRPLLSSLALAAIVIFLALPFGSDYYLLHYLYYTHLSLPLALGLTHRLWLDGAAWLETRWPRFRAGAAGPALACANAGLWFFMAVCFRSLDDPQMYQNHGDVPHPAAAFEVEGVEFLAGLRTHSARAWNLAEVRRRMEPYRDLPLVVLGQCPLCILVSEAKPLLPSPWPDLFSQPVPDFMSGLERAAEEGRWPMVLMVDPQSDGWALDWEHHQKKYLLQKFLVGHNYTLELDQTFFKLYLPPGRGRGKPAFFPPLSAKNIAERPSAGSNRYRLELRRRVQETGRPGSGGPGKGGIDVLQPEPRHQQKHD